MFANRRLEKRLEEAEKRLGDMEDSFARVVELEADWQDWLHKIRNVLARLNQRAKNDEVKAEQPVRSHNPAALRLLGLGGEQ